MKIWKIVVCLVVVVVAMMLPIAIGIWLAFTGPPPYLLREDGLGPEWVTLTPHDFPDGSSVTVSTHADEAAAKARVDAVLDAVPRSCTEFQPGLTRYTRRDSNRRGLVLPLGSLVIHIEAADDSTINARLGSLPFVAENSEKGVITLLYTRHLPSTSLGVLGFSLLWYVLLSRCSSWATSLAPPPGVTPAEPQTLRDRLLAVNDLGLPFRVREVGRRGRLMAEWRIGDARWLGLTEAGGLTRAHQVYLDLDPNTHMVRAIDVDRTVSWRAGFTQMSWSWTFFQGINFFHYERGALVGLFFKDGGWTTTAYDYRFQLAEMRNPLIHAIVGSGWTFAPVVSFFRPLGG
jgi:hypothetical protein